MPESSTDSPKSKVRFGFNAKSREAQAVAKRYAAEQVDRITKETKNALKRVISASIREGIPPRDAAKQIREMVGLNRPQGLALRRYVQKLPPSLSPAAKAKAGIKLKNKMIRRRAITIARTEVIDSLSGGVEQAWVQAQQKGLLGSNAKKEWVTTPFGACAICRALNGQSVKITGMFSSEIGPLARPTAHPNCRCGIAPVPGVGGMMQPAGLPPTVTPSMAAALTSEGLLIHGSDARKAILKYADDPDSVYNKKLEKARKRYADESAKNKETLNNHIDDYRRLGNLADEEEEFLEQFFSSEMWAKYPRLSQRRLVDKRTGELVSINDVKTRLKNLRSQREGVREQMQKVTASAHEAQQEIEILTKGLHDEILETFIYNKTRNTNLAVEISEKSRVTPRSQRFRKTMKNKKEREAFEEGVDAWRRMTDDELFAATIEGDELRFTPNLKPATVKVFRERERAYAQSWGDRDYQVHLVLDDVKRGGKATTVHELTHTVEYGNPDLLAEAINWSDIKTHGDELKKLSELTGIKGYKAREVAYEDNFVTLDNPGGKGDVYIGKRYRTDVDDRYKVNKVYTKRSGWQGSTEVSTMSMELMYSDPVRFARELPELFDFVFERIIRRKYTNTTSRWSLRGNSRFTFEMKFGGIRRYELQPVKE